MDKDVNMNLVMAIYVGNFPKIDPSCHNIKQYREAEMLEVDYEKSKNKNKLVEVPAKYQTETEFDTWIKSFRASNSL